MFKILSGNSSKSCSGSQSTYFSSLKMLFPLECHRLITIPSTRQCHVTRHLIQRIFIGLVFCIPSQPFRRHLVDYASRKLCFHSVRWPDEQIQDYPCVSCWSCVRTWVLLSPILLLCTTNNNEFF